MLFKNNKGAFRGVPRGPWPPFCPGIFFFCKHNYVGWYFKLCYLNIFSLINFVNKKIYRTLSLLGGCALAEIAPAPASIIKC